MKKKVFPYAQKSVDLNSFQMETNKMALNILVRFYIKEKFYKKKKINQIFLQENNNERKLITIAP